MFKIVNGLVPTYLTSLIPPQIQTTTNYPLRNRTNFRIPRARTQLMQQSFLPATLRQWNNLSSEIRNCKSLNTFKNKIKFKPNPSTRLYSISLGPFSKYHTQIPLGLSKLRSTLSRIHTVKTAITLIMQENPPPIISFTAKPTSLRGMRCSAV